MIRSGQAGRPETFEPQWWRDEAACKGMDPDLFYPSTGRRPVEALAACGRCPVQADCLDWATRTGQDLGIWGGKTANERALIRWGRKAS